MHLLDEQRQLIEKFVKSNNKFSGNEDLYDDFCNEAYQKSYMIFNTDYPVKRLENYVYKVVNTSILVVLKDYGRVRKTSQGYVSTNELSMSQVKMDSKLPSQEQSGDKNYVANFDFPDPKQNFEDIIVKKDLLQRIADVVATIHKEKPQKCYLDIFYLRYIKNLKQSEISARINLSQAEVSKRLLELSKLIKSYLNS